MKQTLIAAVAAALIIGFSGHYVLSSEPSPQHNKPGFVTFIAEGRIWVFRDGAKELAEFKKTGELGKMAARIGAGPNGMTIRSPDTATIDAYLAAK